MPTPGRFLAGVAINLDDSYERVTRERPRHLPRGRQPSPLAEEYGRHAKLQQQRKAKALAQAADQAQETTIAVAWNRYPPCSVGRKPRVQATPSTGTPGVRVLESDDWRNLNSNTPSCTALEKMAKFKQEKEMLRTLRKTKTSKARNDPNQFRPSWMQIDKPKRKPGEGVPTTALPQASLKSNAIKSGEEEEKRRRLRRRLKAMARLSPLTSKLEGGEEPDWSQVRSLRKKVKKLSKEIQGGSRLLKSMKMKRDLF